MLRNALPYYHLGYPAFRRDNGVEAVKSCIAHDYVTVGHADARYEQRQRFYNRKPYRGYLRDDHCRNCNRMPRGQESLDRPERRKRHQRPYYRPEVKATVATRSGAQLYFGMRIVGEDLRNSAVNLLGGGYRHYHRKLRATGGAVARAVAVQAGDIEHLCNEILL